MSHYSIDKRARIFDSTDGRCHICRKHLDFDRYGDQWEIDHSQARAKGGSNSLRNLRPACISCNRSKQDRSNRSVRAKHGYTGAPLSRSDRSRRERRGAALGAGAGFVAGGPVGALLGGVFGLLAGRRDPS